LPIQDISTIQIQIQNLDFLNLRLPRKAGINLKIDNVTSIETIAETDDQNAEMIDLLGITFTQLYFYLVVVLSGLLGFCVLVVIPSIICCLYRK
jgi:hypothetical protein